jgi:hypothetical protein
MVPKKRAEGKPLLPARLYAWSTPIWEALVSTSKPELRLVPNATSVLSPNDAHALDIVLDAVFETICSLYEQDMLPSDVGQAIDTLEALLAARRQNQTVH